VSRSRRGGLWLALCASIAAMLIAPAEAMGQVSWSAPVLVDRVAPTADGYALDDIACPSRQLCVAVDDAGHVLSTTRPPGGARAWRSVDVHAGSQTSIACPSARLCVAGARRGVLVSTDPTGGAKSWHAVALRDRSGIDSISCPSTHLCVAADQAGNVLSSTDPSGGARTWRKRRIDKATNHYLLSISCPTTRFCAAVDWVGVEVFTTTHPRAGANAWHRRKPYSRQERFNLSQGIACPSASLCLVLDDEGHVLSSTTPLTGGWHRHTIGHLPLGSSSGGIACRSERLCFAF
jgi:hypothetical protein